MISRVIGVARTVGLVLGCLLLLQHASAQHLYIRAINTLGAAVTDLTADEITVREDGVTRKLFDVRLANLPMKLTVIVDGRVQQR